MKAAPRDVLPAMLAMAFMILSGCSTKTQSKDASAEAQGTDVGDTASQLELPSAEVAEDAHAPEIAVRYDWLSEVTVDVPVDVPSPADVSLDDGANLHQELLDGMMDLASEELLDDVSGEVGDPLLTSWPAGTLQDHCGKGALGVLESPSGDLGLLVLRGSHYEMGYQAGCLIGGRTGEFFGAFLSYYLEEIEKAAADMGLAPEQSAALLYSMVNNIWEHMLPYVPQDYIDEMQGFEDAVYANPEATEFWGETEPAWGCKTLVLLSNLSDLNWSGSIEDVIAKLADGGSEPLQDYYEGQYAQLMLYHLVAHARKGRVALPLRTSCSFFAAWGERTEAGHLLGSRNLDWSTDTGISSLKGITIYAPDDGYAHAAIGYMGFPGALAGMNEKGIILSEVGAESAMERLKGQPWTLKFREIMKHAADLETAVNLATGEGDANALRPTTIGYNWMVAFGDPPTGVGASAAALETNGVVAGVYHRTADCQDLPRLVHYDADGAVEQVVTNQQDPWMANLESEAVEVDAQGQPRLFTTDESGAVALGDDGCPVAGDGDKAFPVGKILPCTLYRGDEALMHGVRMWQTASHGPQATDKTLCSSGSYRNRYKAVYQLLHAFENGLGFEKDGKVYAEETGQKVAVGLEQAEKVAKLAAMGSNVMSIAYDATALAIRISYEIGTGPTWQAAHKHDYIFIDLKSFFDLL
jgi:hypothetical protein